MDLEVRRGDGVLVTGGSGSGKTTLVELLSARRGPTDGEVRLGSGVRVVRVPQAGDDYIFHGSLLFNVLCGSTWPATDEAARVSLVRALMAQPDVLILDETLAPLDPELRHVVLRVAREHAEAVVVVAHPRVRQPMRLAVVVDPLYRSWPA